MPRTVMHRSTTSQLNLVDLAGSERVLRSGATGVALQVSCPFATGLCVLGVGTTTAGVFTFCIWYLLACRSWRAGGTEHQSKPVGAGQLHPRADRGDAVPHSLP